MTSAAAPTKIKGTSITTPTASMDNHTLVLGQLKETTEIAQRLRGDPQDSFVRVSELINATGARLINGTVQPPNTTTTSTGGGTVTTADSVQGTGAPGSPVQLVNDSASPGNSMVYGTNGSGVKGWYTGAGGGGGGGSSPYNVTPDTHTSTPSFPANDEFEGASLDTTGSRFSGATPWTWQNQGPATATLEQGRLVLSSPSTSAPPYNQRCIFQPVPAGTWKFRIKRCTDVFVAVNYSWSGIILWDSVGGQCCDFHRIFSGSYTTEIDVWGALSSSVVSPLATSNFFSSAGYPWTFPVYQEIEYDGTNYIFRYSFDGGEGTFTVFYSVAATSLLGGALANNIGLNLGATSGSPATAYIDWFRRIS